MKKLLLIATVLFIFNIANALAATIELDVTACSGSTSCSVTNYNVNDTNIGHTIAPGETGTIDSWSDLPSTAATVEDFYYSIRHSGENGIDGFITTVFRNEAGTQYGTCSDNTIQNSQNDVSANINVTSWGCHTWTVADVNDLEVTMVNGDTKGPDNTWIYFAEINITYTEKPAITATVGVNATPVTVGDEIRFNVTATDGDGDNYRITVCESNGISDGYPGTCTGTEICTSSAFGTGVNGSCLNITTVKGDFTAYAFACDEGSSQCTSAGSVAYTVEPVKGVLNVTINSPANKTDYSQYDVFDINATVLCDGPAGAECGTVQGFAQYNISGLHHNENISVVDGNTPMFISGGGSDSVQNSIWRPKSWSSSWATPSSTPINAFDKLPEDQSTFSDYNDGIFGVNRTYIFNWTSDDYQLFTNPPATVTSSSKYISKENGLISNNGTVLYISRSANTNTPTTNYTFNLPISISEGLITVTEETETAPGRHWIYDLFINETGGAGYSFWDVTNPAGEESSNATIRVGQCLNEICGQTEFSTANYTSVNQSDDFRMPTDPITGDLKFNFKINESVGSIKALEFYMEARTDNPDASLAANWSVWNDTHGGYVQIGNVSGDSDNIYTFIVNDSGVAEVVSDLGYVHLYVLGGASAEALVDYIRVNVVSSGGVSNPQLGPELVQGDATSFNWTVNLSAASGDYVVGVKFNSSTYDESQLLPNSTEDRLVGISAVADTCTYTSGQWNIDCSDNCVITTDYDLGGNNLEITGTGRTVFDGAAITGIGTAPLVRGTDSNNICEVILMNSASWYVNG